MERQNNVPILTRALPTEKNNSTSAPAQSQPSPNASARHPVRPHERRAKFCETIRYILYPARVKSKVPKDNADSAHRNKMARPASTRAQSRPILHQYAEYVLGPSY